METILEYSGYLNHKLVTTLISDLEKKRDEFKLTYNSFKKILTIMVELLENSYHYSSQINKNEIVGKFPKTYFSVKKQGNLVEFYSGNLIGKDDWILLQKRIGRINELEREDLREEYKNLLKRGIYNREGSAGIGLLRIKKMVHNNFDYEVEELDKEFSFFKMIIKLNL